MPRIYSYIIDELSRIAPAGRIKSERGAYVQNEEKRKKKKHEEKEYYITQIENDYVYCAKKSRQIRAVYLCYTRGR